MRLYLDCCCYNRPFDNLSQARVNDEKNAIMSLINRNDVLKNIFIGSEILENEIEKITDRKKKDKIQSLYQITSVYVPCTREILEFAEKIMANTSVRFMDSLHLASAELGGADIFLTTDYRLIRSCKNVKLNCSIMNPADYFIEVIKNDGY